MPTDDFLDGEIWYCIALVVNNNNIPLNINTGLEGKAFKKH